MKVLIWFACAFVYSIIVTLISYQGVVLGGIPTVILSLLLVFLPATVLCKAWDNRKQNKADLKQKTGSTTTTAQGTLPLDGPSVLFCRKCGFKLIKDSGFCSRCGASIAKDGEFDDMSKM